MSKHHSCDQLSSRENENNWQSLSRNSSFEELEHIDQYSIPHRRASIPDMTNNTVNMNNSQVRLNIAGSSEGIENKVTNAMEESNNDITPDGDSDDDCDEIEADISGLNDSDDEFDSCEIVTPCEGNVSATNINADGSRKRSYTFIKRKRDNSTSKNRRKHWLATLESMTEAKLRRTKCCKKQKCFQKVDYFLFMNRSKQLLSASNTVRKHLLQAMKGSNGKYFFDGNEVCVRFLKQSFKFSTSVLADNSSTDKSDVRTGNIEVSSQIQSEQAATLSNVSLHPSTTSLILKVSPKKDAIISFLSRLSDDCSEKMPDKEERHLPFFQKREVYALFMQEYNRLYNDDAPTPHYFLRTWKRYCFYVKVRKNSRFTVCDECEELRAAIKDAVLNGRSTSDLKSRQRAHLKMVADERMEYQKKRDRARLDPSSYCSIIVDGADQSAYGLPHFTTKTKSQTGHSLKVKLIGALEHNVQNFLHLFTMTDEHETGANHIVETIHRFLNCRRHKGPLPPTLFVQVDNCSRENKNKFLMAYMEFLVAASVFETVEISFLPVGHTHEDIDQCFSQTSGRLNRNNAVSLNELHQVLEPTNQGRTKISHMRRVVNWNGLCESGNYLRRINNITKYRYFKFTRAFRDEDGTPGEPVSTTCHTKFNCYDSWAYLFPARKGEGQIGILKSFPDLKKTPALKISCPEGVEKVSKRFISEEGRINDAEKMIQLQQLRDFVFSSRTDEFHWDLNSTVETEKLSTFESVNTDSLQVDEICPQNEIGVNHTTPIPPSSTPTDVNRDEKETLSKKASLEPLSRVTYSVGSFVAIRSEEEDGSSSDSFWIGKVLSTVILPGKSFVSKINVHWYDPKKKEDHLQSPYYPCYNTKGKDTSSSKKICRRKLQVPFTDLVDTDTVLITFESLTKRHTLPLSVQKKLSS